MIIGMIIEDYCDDNWDYCDDNYWGIMDNIDVGNYDDNYDK